MWESSSAMAADLVFTNHIEALMAVGASNGIWNWCFIGPDPKTFPVVGGGAYSIPEMKQCFEQIDKEANPVVFGLLRLGFTAGTKRLTKHVFIIASDSDSGAGAAKRGIAMGHRELMEKTFAKLGHAYVCVIDTHSADQISPDNVLDHLTQAISVDKVDSDEGASLSLEAYLQYLEEEKERSRLALEEAMRKKAQEEEEAARKKAQEEADAASAEAASAAEAAAAAELARRKAEGDEPCRVKDPKDASLNAFHADHQHDFISRWKNCPNGHPLTKEKEGLRWHQRDAVNCDVCALAIERNSFRLRCNESCDYDVCSSCFGIAYAQTLSAQPVTMASGILDENACPQTWLGLDKPDVRTPGTVSVPDGHTVVLAWTGIEGHEAHPEHEEPGHVQMLSPDCWSSSDATKGNLPKEGKKVCVWYTKPLDVEVGAQVEAVLPFDTCNATTNIKVMRGMRGTVQSKRASDDGQRAAWLIQFTDESIFHWVWVDHLHKLKPV